MPLMCMDIIEGRTLDEIKALTDAVHRAMLAAFKVPERDRYQIVQEHKATHFIVQDTGLDIPRTEKFVLIRVTTRPRTTDEKQSFYRLVCEELKTSCAIETSDVMVSMVSNTDEDWSFGYGRAQFLTKEL